MRGKVDARTMREMNRSLILDLIGREATITRIDLSRRSALTKPTVSTIVDSLIEEGLVREVGLGVPSAHGGRRGRLLGLAADAAAYAGVHLSIRYTSIAVADARGRVRAARTVPSFKSRPEQALRQLPGLLDEVLREAGFPRRRLRGVGVAVPGLVDHTTGTCVLAPNLRWYDVPLRARLSEALGVPASVRNTMQAGAVAEVRLGAAQGARSFAWVYVGSGVGSGIVIDGRVFYGKRGYSGELGHCVVTDAKIPCACGRVGCLETIASVPAIEAAARKAWSKSARTRKGGGSPDPDAYEVAAAADAGDARARAVIAKAGDALGIGISSLLNLLDLEKVVLAGRVVRAGNYLLESVRASVARRAMQGDGTPIVASTVEDDVVTKGAVLVALGGDSVERGIPEEEAEATRTWTSPRAMED
jgi:predicted NBD/HSP70 family sugar kinase